MIRIYHGLNYVPANQRVGVRTTATQECDFIWRLDLYKGKQVKKAHIKCYPHNKGKFGHGSHREKTLGGNTWRRAGGPSISQGERPGTILPSQPTEENEPHALRQQTRRVPGDIPTQKDTLDSYPETKVL